MVSGTEEDCIGWVASLLCLPEAEQGTFLPMLELCLHGLAAQEGLQDPFFVRISIAVLRLHNQNQLGECKVYFSLHITVYYRRESWQELMAGQDSGGRN